MRKPNVILEWRLVDSDTEWEHLQKSLLHPDSSSLQRFLWTTLVILLLLGGVGGYWWYKIEVELPLIMGELNTIDDVSIEIITWQEDQVAAKVVLPAKGSATQYRQTRFYQRSATGWLPTAPKSALWGAPATLATPHFIFHFRQNDAQAVITAAPHIDAFYTTMRRNFGLPSNPSIGKLPTDVSLLITSDGLSPFLASNSRLTVPSPALYLAPIELTDAEILYQSLAFALITSEFDQLSRQHALPPSWQPILSGLYVWQLWDADLPLAVWQEEIVQWFYRDRSMSGDELPNEQLKHYPALCATYQLWRQTPLPSYIPLPCYEQEGEGIVRPAWWYAGSPPKHLAQLTEPELFDFSGAVVRGGYPGRAIVIATLIEYVVSIYGYDHLPILLAGLAQYKDWDTLLPAVMGVSSDEFERGWQNFLQVRYGV